MKNVKWKMMDGARVVARGVMTAESDREALSRVLSGSKSFTPDPDKSYTIYAGELVTSSYGDEFERTANAAGWAEDEPPVRTDGYQFPSPDPVRDGFTGTMQDTDEVIYPGVKALSGTMTAEEARTKILKETGKDTSWSGVTTQQEVDHCIAELQCPAVIKGAHRWEDVPNTSSPGAPLGTETCVQCHANRFKKNYATGKDGGGTSDKAIGYATHDAKEGEYLNVKMNVVVKAIFIVTYIAGEDLCGGQPVRLGTSDRVYSVGNKVQLSYQKESKFGTNIT